MILSYSALIKCFIYRLHIFFAEIAFITRQQGQASLQSYRTRRIDAKYSYQSTRTIHTIGIFYHAFPGIGGQFCSSGAAITKIALSPVISSPQSLYIIYQAMQINHNLENGLHDLKPEYTDEVATLFANTFLEMNQIWASAHLDKEVLIKFLTKQVREHIESEARVRVLRNDPKIRLNQVYVHNQKIVGATLHMELEEYKRLSQQHSEQSEIELFRELEREGKELIKAVDLDSFEKGKYVYASWGAQYRIPELKNLNKIQQIAMLYSRMQEDGFKGMIFRCSNEKIVYFHTTLGGHVLKEVPFAKDEKNYKLWFMQEDFDNPKMQKIIEEAKASL